MPSNDGKTIGTNAMFMLTRKCVTSYEERNGCRNWYSF